MKYGYWLPFLLLAFCACQSVPPEAPLVGKWRFQQQDQTIFLPNGTVVEKITHRPPQASYRSLDVTATDLVYYHAMRDKSFPGDSLYTVTRSYTRQGNTLLVVPYPGIEAGPVRIYRLTRQYLTLRSEVCLPGSPYTRVDLSFSR
jgi:hypothetical protein